MRSSCIFFLSFFVLFSFLTIPINAECRCRFKNNTNNGQKSGALNFVCGVIKCDDINPGGDSYYPDTLDSHAAWAINAYWKQNPQDRTACDFAGTAALLCE